MSETVMGQIGEYRKLSLEEVRERFGQKCRQAQALDLQAQKENDKLQLPSLRVHSRVRVVSITIRTMDSRALRCNLIQCLGATGTVINFDPRWTLPWRVRLDNDDLFAFAEDNLQVLELPTGAGVIQRLVEAIGRHPVAEDDPDVIDAINAVGAALAGEPT